MALFDNFPYTNFHELNLDWLIKKVEEIDAAFPEGTVGIEKGGTGADNADDARTNLGIYATNIPTSALNPATVENRLQALAADISALDGNIDYRIFRSVTKLGQTAGTATLGSCWAAMSTGDILICPPTDFNPAQVPETAGSVVMVRNGGTSGSLRFYGNRTYEMPFVANYPSGEWRQILNSTDVIPIANGGTGGTTAAEALQNLGIDFSGEVLSVAGVGADPTGDVPLRWDDPENLYTDITQLGIPVGSTLTALWNIMPAQSYGFFKSTDITGTPSLVPGTLIIYKGPSGTNNGFIEYKSNETPDYRMFLTAGSPTGVWKKVGADEPVDFASSCEFPKGTPGQFNAYTIGKVAYVTYQGPAINNYAANDVLVRVPATHALNTTLAAMVSVPCVFNNVSVGSVDIRTAHDTEIQLNSIGSQGAVGRIYFQMVYPIV